MTVGAQYLFKVSAHRSGTEDNVVFSYSRDNVTFLPMTTAGWLALVALALIAQAAGQSLSAYAMAHLPPRLSSIGLLLQPVMAALFAWMLLGETLGAAQFVGALMVLIGIRVAHQAETRGTGFSVPGTLR